MSPALTRHACGLAVALALGLAGCGGTPQAPSPGAPSPGTPADAQGRVSPALEQFERRQRERAEAAQRAGRLAEAAQAWEVLATLHPDRAEYRERRAEQQRQIAAAVAERLPRAQAAQRRGELDAAAQLYLGVLALDPAHEAAAEGLRAVERERNKRNHIGKLARNTLMRRPGPEAEARVPANGRTAAAKPAPKSTGDRNDLEHAAMLASQGELDDAIALLQAHLNVQRNDAEAKRMLADLVNQRAARSGGQRDAAGGAPAAAKSGRVSSP
ncbi:MAG: hypothetical protein HY855_02925 [Burkholderiales bacterium]|nr:hypothetical protein [Burkholderiales bacterium]